MHKGCVAVYSRDCSTFGLGVLTPTAPPPPPPTSECHSECFAVTNCSCIQVGIKPANWVPHLPTNTALQNHVLLLSYCYAILSCHTN